MNPQGSINCPNCGVLVSVNSAQCPRCGAAIPQPQGQAGQPYQPHQMGQPGQFGSQGSNPHWMPPSYGQSSPYHMPTAPLVDSPPFGSAQFVIALIVALLFGGAFASMANGQIGKGFASLGILLLLIIVGLMTCGLLFPLVGAFSLFLRVDACIIAWRLQNQRPVGKSEWCWHPL